MHRLLLLTLVILASGCVTNQPINTESLASLRDRPGVVAFIDSADQIEYWYQGMMLGIDRQLTSYGPVWDSNRDLSAVHTAELSRLGFQVRSLFAALTDAEIGQFVSLKKQLSDISALDREQYRRRGTDHFTRRTPVSELTPKVLQKIVPQVRDVLLRKGYQNFILISWDGFHVYDYKLNPGAEEFFHNRFWFVDLLQNKIIWSGDVLSHQVVALPLAKDKIYLENDDFAALKSHAVRLTRKVYRGTSSRIANEFSGNVAREMGLNPK